MVVVITQVFIAKKCQFYKQYVLENRDINIIIRA